MFERYRKERWCRKVGAVVARALAAGMLSLVWDSGRVLGRGSETWFVNCMWNACKICEGDAGEKVGIGECKRRGLAVAVQRIMLRP
jgi:hypothetical protein